MTKEEFEWKEMRKRYTKWPSGYFCYICAEPVGVGHRLCKKHKDYFNDKRYPSLEPEDDEEE